MNDFTRIRVTALAGGVGGARLAHGLAQVLPPENLSVVVNTGDDFEHLGLKICPDMDTVMYTLAGVANPQTGWGLAGESFHCAPSERLAPVKARRAGDPNRSTPLVPDPAEVTSLLSVRAPALNRQWPREYSS